MKRNMGKLDRVTRALLGLAFVGIGFAMGGNAQLFVLGGVATLTGLVGLCPAYLPFGFDTLDEAESGTAFAWKAEARSKLVS